MMCTHAACVHMPHRGRQTHSKSAVPGGVVLVHFSLKLWLLECRTSLALTVPKQTRQKPRVCSAGPHQSSILVSFFCHPFPKVQYHTRPEKRQYLGHRFPTPLQAPPKRGDTSQSISAALTSLNSQFLKSFAGLQSVHHTLLCTGKTGAEWELVPTLV